MINWYQRKKILRIIPLDVQTVLDIGSRGEIFKDYKTTTLDIENADILQNLSRNQKLNLESNSFNLVVASQVLEHLSESQELNDEIKRVSNKYILIGLPNEFTLDLRLKYLFGKAPYRNGYDPFGHKHTFDIHTIQDFVDKFFPSYNYKKYYVFGCSGGRFFTEGMRTWLANTFPNFFAKEVYYLIEVKK